MVVGALIGLAWSCSASPASCVLTAVGVLPDREVGAVTARALAALVSKGPVTTPVVVGVTVLVQQLEGNLLQPVVMGRSLDLHPSGDGGRRRNRRLGGGGTEKPTPARRPAAAPEGAVTDRQAMANGTVGRG